jgi:ABC-2 type transport system permease protein
MMSKLRMLAVVMEITFDQLLWSKRTIFIELLALLPPAIAAIWRISIAIGMARPLISESGLFSALMVTAYLQFLMLLVSLFYGTALVADEVDNKTLTYLTTRPVPKHLLLSGKLTACLLVCIFMIYHSLLLTYFILYSMKGVDGLMAGSAVLLKDLLVMLLGIIAYSCIFSFLGAVTKRPLLIGLIFCAGWESLITYLPGLTRKFTVMHFLQSMFPHISGQDMALLIPNQNATLEESLTMIAFYSALFLGLSLYAFTHREYVFEQ